MLDLDLPTLISRIFILIIAFTVHELAHALTATYFGDDTPRINGRLTLNPIAHLDPMGSLLLIVAGFGWAKPVPVNPYALARTAPSALMWVSLAGPFSNLILAVLAAIPFRMGLVSFWNTSETIARVFPSPANFLFEFIIINLLLMLFNLIPIPPLDGDKIFDYFLPPSWSRALDPIRQYGPIILLAVVFLGPMLGLNILEWIIGPPMRALLQLLVG